MISVRHIGLVTKDIDQSIGFYTNLLGFKVKKDQVESGGYIDTFLGLSDVRVRTVKMELKSGGMIELLYFFTHLCNDKSPDITAVGCSHIALTVPDVDIIYDKINEAGCETINRPSLSPDGKAKVFFCKDPDGTWLELVEEIA
jgi:lactoylglutathione lyase